MTDLSATPEIPDKEPRDNRIVIVDEDLFKKVKKILKPILRYPHERQQNNRVIREAIHAAAIAYHEPLDSPNWAQDQVKALRERDYKRINDPRTSERVPREELLK